MNQNNLYRVLIGVGFIILFGVIGVWTFLKFKLDRAKSPEELKITEEISIRAQADFLSKRIMDAKIASIEAGLRILQAKDETRYQIVDNLYNSLYYYSELSNQIQLDAKIKTVQISEDSRFVQCLLENGNILNFDLFTGQKINDPKSNISKIQPDITDELRAIVAKYVEPKDTKDLSVSKDHRFVVIATVDNWLYLLDKKLNSYIEKIDSPNLLTHVLVNPDQKTFVTAGTDGTITVWDFQSHEKKVQYKLHQSLITSLEWIEEGKQLLSTSMDKTIKIWNLFNQKVDKSFSIKESSNVIAYDRTKRILYYGQKNGAIYGKQIDSGQDVQNFTGHTSEVTALVFYHTRRLLVSGARDGNLKLWDLNNQIELRNMKSHTDTIHSVHFIPDSDFYVTSSKDKTSKVWTIDRKEPIYTLSGHTEPILTEAISNMGDILYTSSVDKSIRVWDLNQKSNYRTIYGHKLPIIGLSLSKDSRKLFSIDSNSIYIWKIFPIRELVWNSCRDLKNYFQYGTVKLDKYRNLCTHLKP